MLRRLAAISLVGLFCWPGPCAAQANDPGPVRFGDRWSYVVKDGATGDLRHDVTFVVAEVNDKEITTRLSFRGRDRPQTVIFDPHWGPIDNGVWQHRPSGIGIRGPLQVGKEWRSQHQSKNLRSGAALSTSAVAKVVGQEQVSTPAGTFDTYRVDVQMRQVNANDQTKSSTLSHVLWYAPAVNRWVKRVEEVRFEGRLRDSFVEELTEYSRRP